MLFLSFIVMVPYDCLFHREKIRANWQDMKNVFGIFAGEIPQVKKKKEPPAWNVWFTRNRIIKTGPDVFRPLDPKLDLSALDGAGLLLAKIFLSVLLTALGLYHRLARYAGAGTLVPITGFANAVASPAIDFRAEGIVTGTAVKMFTVAGPVIVFGTAASVVYGLVLYLLA